MMNFCEKKPGYSPILTLALFLFMIMPSAADETPPGGSGVGILTLGGQAATSVELIPPNNIENWALSPTGTGENTISGTFKVKANGDWQVSATDSSSTTSGHMTEWDGSQYITQYPKQLDRPMTISAASGGYIEIVDEVELPSGGMIAIGTNTNNQQINLPVIFNQQVLWTDKVLDSGHSYKIVVTFTITGYTAPP